MLSIRPVPFYVHGLLSPQGTNERGVKSTQSTMTERLTLGIQSSLSLAASEPPYGWLKWGSPVEKEGSGQEGAGKRSPREAAWSHRWCSFLASSPSLDEHFQATSIKGAWQKIDSSVPSADYKLKLAVGVKLTPSEWLQDPGGVVFCPSLMMLACREMVSGAWNV